MAKKIDYASMFTLRKDGRYQGYYRDSEGHRHVVCDKDPQALYFKIQAKETDDRPILFSDLLELYDRVVWEKLPEGTKASYGASRKRAKEEYSHREAAAITAYDIDNFLERLKIDGLSAGTINTQRVVLRAIFYQAIIHKQYGKIIKTNPAREVKLPKGLPKQKKREAPEDDVIQKIQECAGSVPFGDFVLFLICTGMRRGEALAIKWEDVDFDAGMISVHASVSLRGSRGVVNDTKTDNGVRQVPILPPLLPHLVKPANAKQTDYVFHGEDPSLPMANSCYQRRWRSYCKAMGFVIDTPEERISKQKKKYIVHHYKNTLTAHCLRHGYATLLYEAGIDEKEAAALMGHADEEMLRKVYQHLRDKKKAKASDILKQKTKNGLVGIE